VAIAVEMKNAMIRRYISQHDMALDSRDLAICQRAFDAILLKRNIQRDSEEAERVAAMIIALYRQGVHDENQLVTLADPAAGGDKFAH